MDSDDGSALGGCSSTFRGCVNNAEPSFPSSSTLRKEEASGLAGVDLHDAASIVSAAGRSSLIKLVLDWQSTHM